MNTQLSIFDVRTAALARDNGIEQAMKSANTKIPEWSEQAYDFLLDFIKANKGNRFMVEDFRAWCADRLPMPPSLRAYGGLIVRARNAGLIYCCGTDRVKNVKAHMANAAVWIVK